MQNKVVLDKYWDDLLLQTHTWKNTTGCSSDREKKISDGTLEMQKGLKSTRDDK